MLTRLSLDRYASFDHLRLAIREYCAEWSARVNPPNSITFSDSFRSRCLNLDPEGLFALIEVNQRQPGFTKFALVGDQIGDAGARAIAERLTTLTKLHLPSNQIGDLGARAIAERLTNLTLLDRRNNPISEAERAELRERMKLRGMRFVF